MQPENIRQALYQSVDKGDIRLILMYPQHRVSGEQDIEYN